MGNDGVTSGDQLRGQFRDGRWWLTFRDFGNIMEYIYIYPARPRPFFNVGCATTIILQQRPFSNNNDHFPIFHTPDSSASGPLKGGSDTSQSYIRYNILYIIIYK